MSVFKNLRIALVLLLILSLATFWLGIFFSGDFSILATKYWYESSRCINTSAAACNNSWKGLLKSLKSITAVNKNFSALAQLPSDNGWQKRIPRIPKSSNSKVSTSGIGLPTRSDKLDIVLRSAFIDLRARAGHANSTVIFAEVSKEFRKYNLILGCGVDEFSSVAYEVRTLYWDWIDYRYPNLTHEEIVIFCYDVPARNGSTVFILYHQALASTAVSKESISITLPSPERVEQRSDVVICTTCFGRPPWLEEWLKYQKTLGVDSIQMYVDDRFISDSQNMKIVSTYVSEGFLKIEYRKEYFNSTQIYYHSQTLNYNDCLYRHQSTHQYAMFIDTDDFFVPRLYNTSLKYYLQKILKGNKGATRFHWYKFFPDCGLVQPPHTIVDGNVTSKLKISEYVTTTNSKFACRPSLTTQVTVHKPLHLLNGYQEEYTVDSSQAYVAHLRLHQLQGLPENVTCDKHTG